MELVEAKKILYNHNYRLLKESIFKVCASCDCDKDGCTKLKYVADEWGDDVYWDFHERNYDDEDYICEDCLNECYESLNEFKNNKQ